MGGIISSNNERKAIIAVDTWPIQPGDLLLKKEKWFSRIGCYNIYHGKSLKTAEKYVDI